MDWIVQPRRPALRRRQRPVLPAALRRPGDRVQRGRADPAGPPRQLSQGRAPRSGRLRRVPGAHLSARPVDRSPDRRASAPAGRLARLFLGV